FCPAFVVISFKVKKACISLSFSQKKGVIPVRIFSILIFSETFLGTVIIMVHHFTFPLVTFYTKVIVSPFGEVSPTCTRFKNSLGEGNTCRYLIKAHLFHCNVGVLVDITLDNICISCGCSRSRWLSYPHRRITSLRNRLFFTSAGSGEHYS